MADARRDGEVWTRGTTIPAGQSNITMVNVVCQGYSIGGAVHDRTIVSLWSRRRVATEKTGSVIEYGCGVESDLICK